MEQASSLTAIEVLSAFNGAVVTNKLYPASAPQVRAHLERSFKVLSEFLIPGNSLVIGRVAEKLILNGSELAEDDLSKITNLVLYRQLETLGLDCLVLEHGIDQFTYRQIVTVFSAKKEKISREGGGRGFVIDLGISSCFPENCLHEDVPTSTQNNRVVRVTPHLLSALFASSVKEESVASLKESLSSVADGAELIAAGIGRLLVALSKKKECVRVGEFAVMLNRIDTFSDQGNKDALAKQLASILAPNLQAPAFSILFFQEYPSDFGDFLYNHLLHSVSDEHLGTVLGIYQQYLRQLEVLGAPKRTAITKEVIAKLEATKRVKAFLAKRKTEVGIAYGELERLQKRMAVSLAGLRKKDFRCLANEEFVSHLPKLISSYAEHNREEGAEIVTLLCVALPQQVGGEKSRLITVLLIIGEDLLQKKRWRMLSPILMACYSWMKKSQVADSVYEKIATLLYRAGIEERDLEHHERADGILSLFYGIRTGKIPQNPAVKALVSRVQDSEFDRRFLPVMLKDYLENTGDSLTGKRLLYQGKLGKRYLVDALMQSQDSENRQKIIELLSQAPDDVASIVMERLAEDMPWFGKRNLLKALAETGTVSEATEVLPYIEHTDIRVQREAYLCLLAIGGNETKTLLLKALERAIDSIKSQVIKSLGSFDDDEVAKALATELKKCETDPPREGSGLMLQLLNTLGEFSSEIVLAALESFVESRKLQGQDLYDKNIYGLAEKIRSGVAVAFNEKKKQQHVQVSTLRKQSQRQAAKIAIQADQGLGCISDDKGEPHLRELVEQGQFDEAGQLFIAIIERLVIHKKFAQAEKVREWLIDSCPSLLTPIIHAAEIIEGAKNVSIKKEHLEVWSDLYDVLTTEEFTALYHCLQHQSLQDSQLVVRQGAYQKSLYFINQGRVNLSYSNSGHETLITNLGHGTVLGAGAFFDSSVWTVSVHCLGRTEISILQFDDIVALSEEHPALESKLQDFCVKFEKLETYFKRSSKDRRAYPRVSGSGRVAVQLIDSKGRFVGAMPKGDLCDISAGGVSFLSRLSRRENARVLLGRKVQVALPIKKQDGSDLSYYGQVLGVRAIAGIENEFSVHIKFDKLIDNRVFDKIVFGLKNKRRTS